MVPYIFTGFAGYSVGHKINHITRKLTQTSTQFKKIIGVFSWMIAMPIDARFNEI
jgi:hypothetical protein